MSEQLNDTYTWRQLIVDLGRDLLTSRKAWAIVGGGILVVVYGLESYKSAVQTADKEAVQRQTPAGAFALNTMANCLSSGSIFSRNPTNAECINQTLSAAQNLRGAGFAEDVKVVLAQKYIAN